MPISLQGSSVKLMCSDHKIAKLYCKNNVIYSSGNTVTYHVDVGITYQEEVDKGASCLSPKTFTPAKAGWQFVGWRADTTATSNAYRDPYIPLIMGDDPISLYAVFAQDVTVTYYNNSTAAAKTSTSRYYNNGNIVNPSFTLTQTARSGWTARGWSTGTAGNSEITYANGAAFTRDSSVTLYGLYYQTVTLTYYNGSTSAASTSGTRYYNPGSGGIIDPTFTLTPSSLSGWTFRGWATSSAAAAGIAYGSISGTAFAASTTVYAAYYRTITLSYSGNGATGGSTAAQTGTQYWNTGNVSNPTFTLAANGFARSGYTFSKWALGSAGGTQYAAGASITLSESNTMYAVWTMPQTLIVDDTWCINGVMNSGWTIVSSSNCEGWAYGSWGLKRTLQLYKNDPANTGSFTIESPVINVNNCTTINFGAIYYNQSGNVIIINATNGAIIGYAGGGNISFNISGVSKIKLEASASSSVHSGSPTVTFSGDVTLS